MTKTHSTRRWIAGAAVALAALATARRTGPCGRLQDHRARGAGRRLGPARPRGRAVDAGREAGRAGADHQRRRCRRHDRPRAADQQQQGRRQRADGHRQGHGLGRVHQQVAGHADPGHADRAPDRRVRSAGGVRRFETADHGRPGRDVQGQPGIGVVGRRAGRRGRPVDRGDDRAGDRRRARQVQLRRVQQRRRGAGADDGRPPHGRPGRLQRVRGADRRRQVARARDHRRRSGSTASTSRP